MCRWLDADVQGHLLKVSVFVRSRVFGCGGFDLKLDLSMFWTFLTIVKVLCLECCPNPSEIRYRLQLEVFICFESYINRHKTCRLLVDNYLHGIGVSAEFRVDSTAMLNLQALKRAQKELRMQDQIRFLYCSSAPKTWQKAYTSGECT